VAERFATEPQKIPFHNQLADLGVQPGQVSLGRRRCGLGFRPKNRHEPVHSLSLPAVDHGHVDPVLGCQLGHRLLALDGFQRDPRLELSRVALACNFPHSFSSYPQVGKAY
jgi:hypothetical protein